MPTRSLSSSWFSAAQRTTEVSTLSLRDALPILGRAHGRRDPRRADPPARATPARARADDLRGLELDRKSTRLNSSHANISYAVFCLKKKKRFPPFTYPDPEPGQPTGQCGPL